MPDAFRAEPAGVVITLEFDDVDSLFDVRHRTLEPTHTAAVRATVASDSIETWSTRAFHDLTNKLLSAGIDPSAPMGSMLPSDFFSQSVAEIVAFVPGADPIEQEIVGAEGLRFDGGEFAVTVHHGPYHDLDRTYGALGSYVAEHRIGAPGPIVEHYLIGPDSAGEQDNIRTEVCWPIIG